MRLAVQSLRRVHGVAHGVSRGMATTPNILNNFHDTTLGILRNMTGPDPQVMALEKALKDERAMVQELKERIQDLEYQEMSRAESARKAEEANSHPVLGTLVADLGYKKVYRASLESLQNMPMWEKQRAYRDERAKKIAKDKKDSVVKGGFPGCLVAYEFKQTRAIGLLDGQHRLGAQKHMAANGLCDPEANNVLVEVFQFNDGKQADKLFIEINKAEPVKSIDMPGEVNPNIKVSIDDAVDELHDEFKAMFKVSSKCLAPHVNMDVLREDLFEADVCGRFNLKSKKELLAWLMAKNTEMAKLDDAAWEQRRGSKKPKSFGKALEKARRNNFFLGMDKQWLEKN
uniref:Uncharacterized protein n=1 Tax=Lotharella oceanica TaxID=641309 RepID=A0A7S2XHN0_9EUKA|mmetsp:Transcript_70/g.160  ORF Transcript_70/g.160 Transcript_70/m.160 type:complete len:344 (+) Transcript_70:26-1057(+)